MGGRGERVKSCVLGTKSLVPRRGNRAGLGKEGTPPVSLKGSEKNGSRPVEPVCLLGAQNDAAEISLLILQKGTLGERAPNSRDSRRERRKKV